MPAPLRGAGFEALRHPRSPLAATCLGVAYLQEHAPSPVADLAVCRPGRSRVARVRAVGGKRGADPELPFEVRA